MLRACAATAASSEIAAGALRAGDAVRVPVGQAFAADGVLIEGRTEVDESLLTGESRPVAKDRGDAVIAGSINLARRWRCGSSASAPRPATRRSSR